MRSHLRSTAVALGLSALLVSCAPGPNASPSTGTSETPTGSPSPTAVVPSDTPDPEPSLSPPGSFGDDLTFGYSDFAGIPVGTTHSDFLAETGYMFDGCGTAGNYFYYPADAADLAWILWAPSYENEPEPSDSVDEWKIDYFALQRDYTDALVPFGPTGPEGVRLGSSEADVQAAFPDATLRDYYFETLDMTFRQHIVMAPDDTAMVISTVDGLVVDIRWGSESLAEGWDSMFCD